MNARSGDFQATRVMQFGELPASKRKSEGVAFFDCGCRLPRLARAPRSAWMHLLWMFRLYKCGLCGAKVLRTPLPRSMPYPVDRVHRLPRRVMTVAARPAAHAQVVVLPVMVLPHPDRDAPR